jgi:zinc protease
VSGAPPLAAEQPIVRRLDGGLLLAVHPLPRSPVTSVHLWFEAGASDEDPRQAGVAHLVEHMLFKGTARRGIGQAAAEVESLGGDLNAWTSWDETVIHATLEAGAASEAIDVVLDMASSSLLDGTELAREKLVVLEEIRGYEDDPDTVAGDRLFALVFGEHPYGRPVIGWPKTVEALDRGAVEGFWRSHYHPSRAILAVAGPVDADAIAAEVTARIASWPAGRARAELRPAGQPPGGGLERLDRDFGSAVVQIGWPAPPIGHPDLPALDVLVSALGQGAASRLAVALDLEAGVASNPYADVSAWRAGGAIQAGFLCGDTEEAIRLAVGELAGAARGGLSGTAITRARDGILSDLLFATETADGVAADLAWALARTGDPHERERYRRAVAAVTAADVRRVAKTWLDPEAMRVVVIDREADDTKLRAAAAPASPRSVRRLGSPGDPEIHEVHGTKVAFLPDDGEIAGFRVLGLGGQLVEDAKLAGLSEAWARLVLRGAGDLDATSFGERLDVLGAGVEAFTSRSLIGFQGTVPAANVIELCDRLGDVLVDPRLDPADWDNVREEMLDDIAAQVDRPGQVASETLSRSLWPDHPWRLPPLGTAASLNRIGVRALSRFHRAMTTRANLAFAFVGGLDPDAVLAALEPVLAALPEGRPVEPPVANAPPVGSVAPRHAGREQATVVWGVRGLSYDDPDRTALSVAGNVLDSQSGRLFLSLREERGLAYGVWAHSELGAGGGTFSAGLSTDPARVREAADALRRELLTLTREGPTDGEVGRVRRMVAGLAAMRHQRVAGRASDLAWAVRTGQEYGLPALRARLAAVRPEDVQRVLERIGLDHPLKVVVLPRPPDA